MRKSLLALAVAVLCAAPAVAQPDDDDSGFDQPPREERGERGEEDEGRGRRGRRGPPPNLMFEAIDTNGDQMISKIELRKAVAALQKLDTDGDGNISLAEATPERGPGGRGPGGGPEAFVDRMLEFDANRDGKLSPDEVPERAMPMLEGGDSNQDGLLDREELGAIAQRMGERFRGGRGPGGPGGNPQDFVDRIMENDRNGDGVLTPNELPEQLARMLARSDENRDGAIDPRELAKSVERFQQRGRDGGGPPDGRGNRSYDRAGRGNRGGPDGERPERDEF